MAIEENPMFDLDSYKQGIEFGINEAIRFIRNTTKELPEAKFVGDTLIRGLELSLTDVVLATKEKP